VGLTHYRLAEAAWQQDTARTYLDNIEPFLVFCPAEIRSEGRELIIQAFELIRMGDKSSWPKWHWQYYDDQFRVKLLFTR
jgi:hypothetical protein